MRPSFFNHLHPPTIPAEQSRWRYTLGAGGTGVFLLLVVAATGILEMFYYIPTPDMAAQSIQTITYLVPLGGFVRNLHFWSAQALIVVSAIHLLRVVFTGAYAPPRRFNYLLGLGLFIISLLLDFTGYVLRWDQGVQWALVVGTNLIKTVPLLGNWLYVLLTGGSELGLATLIRFYAWHIFGLTLGAMILTVWHAFRVRRDGGIAVPPPALRRDQRRISRHELARREVAAMLFTGAALVILSATMAAPIAAPIHDLGAMSGNARAPWFFLWVQQVLKWGDPFVLGVALPLGILFLLALLPYVLPKPASAELGRWFPKSNRAAQLIVAIVSAGLIALTIIGRLSTP
ncbi:MAG TPA: cytochrome b N-terminal domain-containing protein [Anaerolineales bacterium]|nr:cytochrome b N-terminal domain-containing protein [Anaerolineales bacterium]